MDSNDARNIFGSDANVERLVSFKMNGGKVDFGDHAHLLGTPRGNAIVVWSIDGRVAVRGILFSDTGFNEAQEAIIDIRFRRTDGTFTNITRRSIISQGLLQWRTIQEISPIGNFNQVRIELKTFTNTDISNDVPITQKTRTFNR